MSAIDPTQPPEGDAFTAPVRENFAQAKADIERVGADDAALDVIGAHPARTDNPHGVTAAQAGADVAGAAAAVQDNLDTHTADTANPHEVTAAQAGADVAGAAAAVQDNLDTHTADTANPHEVTAAQAGADVAGAAAAVQDNLDTHTGDTANPHAVTRAQVNASLLTPGTSCIQNPYAINTTTTQAHGLGATPHFNTSYLECLSAELNYSVGDRVQANSEFSQGSSFAHWCVEYDATNTVIVTGANLPTVLDKTAHTRTAITASKWKFVSVPYLLS